MTEFRLTKRTGTHADVFAAVGLADRLSPLGKAVIEDLGADYRVTVPVDVRESDMETIGQSAGFKYLMPKSDHRPSAPLREEEIFDYAEERERALRYRTAQAQARRAGTAIAAEIQQDAPGENWPLYRALNVLQGFSGSNKIVQAIRSEAREAWASKLFQSLSDLPGSTGAFDWPINLVQVFNPQAAKGYARLKPDSTDRNDKTKDAWAEPFLEWLRYCGYFVAACPFSIGDDIRLLCPAPRRITYRLYRAVVADLRKLNIFSSAVKVDVVSTLRLAQLLIQKSPEFHEPLGRPNNLVSGILIAHYQSMGNAKAVTRVEQLALPGWFDLQTPADAEFWDETLTEHERVIRSLDDSHSDEIGMLLQYRRFLDSRGNRALKSFLEFLEQYGIFLMRERGKGQQWKHRQFQTNHLERMMEQQHDYQSILRNPGFKAVATAIRSATVGAQVLKKLKQERKVTEDPREIRYDLLPDLRRKRALPRLDEFLASVAEFISAYNAESARRYEEKKRSGTARVSTEQFESFVELLDQHRDASLVGAMLCAYATCKDPRAIEEPVVADETTAEETLNV